MIKLGKLLHMIDQVARMGAKVDFPIVVAVKSDAPTVHHLDPNISVTQLPDGRGAIVLIMEQEKIDVPNYKPAVEGDNDCNPEKAKTELLLAHRTLRALESCVSMEEIGPGLQVMQERLDALDRYFATLPAPAESTPPSV